jgi:hypothetical protein
MSEELFRVKLIDSDRRLEVRFVTDCDGWHVLMCEHDLCHLTHEGVDEPVPSITCAISMSEALLRRHLDQSDLLPLNFIVDGEVYRVDVP